MISLLPLAFAAGTLTVAAPCLLPVLPGIVGGSLGRSRMRPLGIVVGLVGSFTVFGTAFAIFLDFLGLSKGTVRTGAIGLLLVFGVFLAVPRLYEWVETSATRAWRTIRPPRDPSPQPNVGVQDDKSRGFWNACGIGATLGAVWTPCAGPIFGTILGFAATTQSVSQSALLFFVFALGAGLPIFLIGYGSRALFLRFKSLAIHTHSLRQMAGVILVVWAVALLFGVDRYIQANIAPLLPSPRL